MRDAPPRRTAVAGARRRARPSASDSASNSASDSASDSASVIRGDWSGVLTIGGGHAGADGGERAPARAAGAGEGGPTRPRKGGVVNERVRRIAGIGAMVGIAVAAVLVVAWRGGDDAADDAGPYDVDGAGRVVAPPSLRAGRGTDPGDGAGPAAGDDVIEREGRVRLGARWLVQVVDAADGHAVADAELEAEVDLVADPRGGASRGVVAARATRTGADGRVTLERMPLARSGAVFAKAAGYLPARVAVEASDALVREVEVRLRARLPLPLASAPVDVFADGRPLAPGDVTLVVALDGAAPREVRPGEPVMVDDDPAGAPTRVASVRVLAPGYAGPPQAIALTRGARARPGRRRP